MTRPYESYLIVGEQDDFEEPINRSEFNGIIYEFESLTLRNSSEPIDPARFTGHASPIESVPNLISSGGDINLELHADNMVAWFRQILMDDMADELVAPSWDEIFGDGMGAGRAWTDPDQVDTQPGDLTPSQVPAFLKFTFSEGVDQVIEIMGTDLNDMPISETLTFTALGDLIQTTEKAYKTVFALQFTAVPGDDEVLLIEAGLESYADVTAPVWKEVFGGGSGTKKAWTDPDNLDTQPGATSPSQSPALLKFTFSGSVTQAIVIAGTDQNDVVITETLSFTGEAGPKTTTKYFKTVTSIDFTTAPPGGETLLIEASNKLYTHLLEIKDTILEGMTIEAVKGGLPSTYVGCLVNTGTLTLGDIVTLACAIINKRGYNSSVVKASGNDVEASETPTDIATFTRVSQSVAPGWGMALQIGNDIIPVATMVWTFNNNLVYPAAKYRNERTNPKPVRNARRIETLVFQIDYDSTSNDWDGKFESGQTVEDVFVYAYRKPYAGPEYSVKISLPLCKINAYPDPSVDNFANLLQEISLTPLRVATTPDEQTVTIKCLASE
jgi:hypothetical protein